MRTSINLGGRRKFTSNLRGWGVVMSVMIQIVGCGGAIQCVRNNNSTNANMRLDVDEWEG